MDRRHKPRISTCITPKAFIHSPSLDPSVHSSRGFYARYSRTSVLSPTLAFASRGSEFWVCARLWPNRVCCFGWVCYFRQTDLLTPLLWHLDASAQKPTFITKHISPLIRESLV